MSADAESGQLASPIANTATTMTGPDFTETIHELTLTIPPHRAGISYPLVPPIVDAMAEDARENAGGLPYFANSNQSRANLVTVISNTLAALTGLAIWATLQQSPAWWAKAAVALTALISAVLGFLPSIYKWNDTAASARRLASRYGHLYGDILTLKGQYLAGTVTTGDEKIEKLRATLEALKDERQEINAEWKPVAVSARATQSSHRGGT